MAGEVGGRSAAGDTAQSVENLAVEQLIVSPEQYRFRPRYARSIGRQIGITFERMKLGGARKLASHYDLNPKR